jgi:hypothetical protein
MNKVHSLSSVVTIPELEIFTVNPTQVAVERNVDVYVRPTSSVQNSSYIEFKFPSSLDQYLLFHESYLNLKFRVILKHKNVAEKTTREDWNNVFPTNNFLHSLFKQAELVIGNQEIVRGAPTYAYKAYIEALLGFSDTSKKTNLSCALFSKDEFERNLVIKPLKDEKDLSQGAIVELMGRLHLDFTFQSKALLGGCVTGLKLTLNNTEFCLRCTDSNLEPVIDMVDAELELNFLKVNPNIVEAHERALLRTPAKYCLTRNEVKTLTIPSGSQSVHLDNVVYGLLPRRVIVGFVDNNAFNGDLTKDPFKFEHYSLCSLASFVDGVQYPTKAYTPDFEKNMCTREYMGLLRAINQNTTDSLVSISKNAYINKGCTLYGFNYAPDMTDGMGDMTHTSLQKRGSLGFNVCFAKPLPNVVNAIFYMEFDTCIEIGKERQPILNYA